jgi:hypothetical protein
VELGAGTTVSAAGILGNMVGLYTPMYVKDFGSFGGCGFQFDSPLYEYIDSPREL